MKKLIDHIIRVKAEGNTFQEMNIKMKLMFKGIPVNSITEDTAVDDQILARIFEAANELNVNLPNQNYHA